MFAVSMVTVISPSSKSSSSGAVVCRDLGRPKVRRRPDPEGVRGGWGGGWFESCEGGRRWGRSARMSFSGDFWGERRKRSFVGEESPLRGDVASKGLTKSRQA
jgi:hypothetical protein